MFFVSAPEPNGELHVRHGQGIIPPSVMLYSFPKLALTYTFILHSPLRWRVTLRQWSGRISLLISLLASLFCQARADADLPREPLPDFLRSGEGGDGGGGGGPYGVGDGLGFRHDLAGNLNPLTRCLVTHQARA